MDLDLNRVELITDFVDNLEIAEEIIRNIRMIFTTPMGTVPFDRDFGIDWSILDKPLPQAKGLLTVEYINKVRQYEPRARVQEVTYKHEGTDGSLIPKVVINLA